MSQSNKKILVSGDGISWSYQEKNTWVSILRSMNVNIVDVGGPAISNQTILNCAINHLICDSSITSVVIQLTGCSKLDVEIFGARQSELVDQDPVRNFTHQGIWPSSKSVHHQAKKLWHKWLDSPTLEIQDIFCKLMLLDHWCQSKNIELTVVQGYKINWSADQINLVNSIVLNNAVSLDTWYKTSKFYRLHDPTGSVPCMQFQIELADYIAKHLDLELSEKIEKLIVIYANHTS
jgi:predicted nucleotidyltransferase